MRCEKCQGTGRLTYDQMPHPKPTEFGSTWPCVDCGGSGTAHCCDGLTACNDPPEEDGGPTRDEKLLMGLALYMTCIL